MGWATFLLQVSVSCGHSPLAEFRRTNPPKLINRDLWEMRKLAEWKLGFEREVSIECRFESTPVKANWFFNKSNHKFGRKKLARWQPQKYKPVQYLSKLKSLVWASLRKLCIFKQISEEIQFFAARYGLEERATVVKPYWHWDVLK